MKLLLAGDEELSAAEVEQIVEAADGVEVIWCRTPEETMAVIAAADALHGVPSRQEFLLAERLRWIQYPGAGVDKVLKIPEIVAGNVVVTNCRGAFAVTMAEYTLGAMLYFSRSLGFFTRMQMEQRWEQQAARPNLNEINGLTLGIVGLGDTGRAIATRATAFDMEVLAIAATTNKPDYAHSVWGIDRLDELLERSDFVVLTVPLTPDTYELIGRQQLARMKPSAYLINICRGPVVDEQALVAALEAGHLAGAALDVFSQEPLAKESKLWAMENVLITPHVSGDSTQHRRRVIGVLLENLRRFQAGEPLVNVVDKGRGY